MEGEREKEKEKKETENRERARACVWGVREGGRRRVRERAVFFVVLVFEWDGCAPPKHREKEGERAQNTNLSHSYVVVWWCGDI